MLDWDRVAALGTYLGIADAIAVADRAPGHPASRHLLGTLAGTLSPAAKKLPPGGADLLIATLALTDFGPLGGRGDRPGLLAGVVYRRIAMLPDRSGEMPQFEAFDRDFRECLCRFAATLRAALYVVGARSEIISIEHPAATDAVEEVRQLPCRSLEGLKAGEATSCHFTASLSGYVPSLLRRHAVSSIGPAGCREIIDIVDHLSAYPGYYRLVEKGRKADAVQTLVSAISALRKPAGDSREKADLVAALGMLLFNVSPSPDVARYLAVHRPGGGNRRLLYEYYTLLALSFLRMGKRAAAAEYCRKACEAAPEPDLEAYARVLEGCVALGRQDYKSAYAALERGMEAADRRQLRSLIGFYLGVVRYDAGDVGAALNCFRDAKIGADTEADAMAACNDMGTCYLVLGDMGRALSAFEEATAMGAYSGRGAVKLNRSIAAGGGGLAYMSMREYDLAREHFARALRGARETGHARGVADQLMNIGLAYKGMGDYASAANHFVSALNYSFTIDYIEGVLYARGQVGQALALQGRHDEEDDIYRDLSRRHPGIRRLLTRGHDGH